MIPHGDKPEMEPCPFCNGNGQVWTPYTSVPFQGGYIGCWDCLSTGQVPVEHDWVEETLEGLRCAAQR